MKMCLKASVRDKIDMVQEYTGIIKKTIVNIAFSNGLKCLDKGFIPRLLQKENVNDRKNIEVEVNDELVQKLEKYAEKLKINLLSLKEMLIELECDRILKAFNENIQENDDSMDLVDLTVEIKVPKNMKERIKDNAGAIKSTHRQYFQYLLLQGFLFYENDSNPLILDKDYYLAQEARILGIDVLKAYTFASFMAKNYLHNKELNFDEYFSNYFEEEKIIKN